MNPSNYRSVKKYKIRLEVELLCASGRADLWPTNWSLASRITGPNIKGLDLSCQNYEMLPEPHSRLSPQRVSFNDFFLSLCGQAAWLTAFVLWWPATLTDSTRSTFQFHFPARWELVLSSAQHALPQHNRVSAIPSCAAGFSLSTLSERGEVPLYQSHNDLIVIFIYFMDTETEDDSRFRSQCTTRYFVFVMWDQRKPPQGKL